MKKYHYISYKYFLFILVKINSKHFICKYTKKIILIENLTNVHCQNIFNLVARQKKNI